MENSRTERFLGESSAILEVLERVSMIAPLNKPVLIIGERGTGKELIGSRVHFLSERWGQPFLKLNCAAISETLLDSELFGHESGAFSGATKQHKGLFERADGGTLFLDELATSSLQVQEKILRVIEYGELTRLGGNKTLHVDVRLVAATNGNLPKLAAQGKFRADLLDRLAFDVITLPPLRYRSEDIMILADFFALGMTKDLERPYFSGFSQQAKAQLLAHNWPGNVRELKNVVERSVYRNTQPEEPLEQIIIDPFASSFSPIDEAPAATSTGAPEAPSTENSQPLQSPAKVANSSNDEINLSLDSMDYWSDFSHQTQDFKQHIEAIEQKLIEASLSNCQFNQRKTAEQLGMTYHQLRGYLRKYKIGQMNDS